MIAVMKVITANNWRTYSCISSEQTEACMLFCRWRVGFDPALELLVGGRGDYMNTYTYGMPCAWKGIYNIYKENNYKYNPCT